MKKTTHSLLFALFLIGMFAFTKSDSWYLVESKPFGFKIEFPVKPAEQTKVINSELGELNMNMFLYDASKAKDDNLVYLASYTEYPKDAVDSDNKEVQKKMLRSGIDGAVNNVQGKLLSEKIITLDGFEGIEARIDFKNGMAIIKMRMYLVHNKMYILETITETSKESNKSVSKFLDSFKLFK
ncbi:MAG TPA: hypothetical protein VKG26_11430 [Bacteroidia bacterium]|nr:hypothetical protein [Bacteroidia bacterium]